MTSAHPIISVVMPVYNVERYVQASIASVLAQNFRNFELIIVDDGGQDESITLCRSIDDPRIRIVSQKNRGLPGARNTGIREAAGKYVAIIDSDDLWHPDKLAKHVAHLDANPDVGVSYAASSFIDEHGNELGLYQRPKLTAITASDVFCRNPIGNGSVPVFRREALEAIAFPVDRNGRSELHYFDESFRYCEDIECWSRIALTTSWRFAGIGDCLTYYRVVSGSLSANTEQMYTYWKKARDKLITYAPEFISLNGRCAEGYQLRYYSRRSVKEGAPLSALKYWARATTIYPMMLIEEPARSAMTLLAALAIMAVPMKAINAIRLRTKRVVNG